MGPEPPVAIDELIAGPRQPSKRAPGRVGSGMPALPPGLVAAGLVLYFGFNVGGFFPGTVGFACVMVIQLLIVRVLLGDHPFEGVSRGVLVTGAALAGFVAWVLLSGLWSHAHDRTLIEFDRGLLYLAIFLLFGLVARTSSRIPWMVRGLAVAIVVCGSVGLFSRLRPDVLHTTNVVAINRLAYPLTYWNALGILCAVGILLLLGLAASRTELRPVRALACGALPILAVTVYFTFSRGALLALTLGIVVFLATARVRGLPGTLLATAPTSAIAVLEAYHQSELSSNTPRLQLAISQGNHMLKVVIACAAAAIAIRAVTLLKLDDRIGRIEVTPQRRRTLGIGAWGALACALIVAVALGAPHWVSRQYHQFAHGTSVLPTHLRARSTDPSSNGRVPAWRVAVTQFDAQPFHGSGAGTYEFVWRERRPTDDIVVDAHSLYVEAMGEMGFVGLLLVVATVVGILVAVARRLRGDNRALYAALLGSVVAWALHAGYDWDWEMPAVTAWVFAVAGTAVAARAGQLKTDGPAAQRSRVAVAATLIVVAATPALLLFSQSSLQASANAFDRGNCTRARAEAFKSIDDLSIRPEPYRIVGYCDIQEGRPADAVVAMQKAVDKTPADR